MNFTLAITTYNRYELLKQSFAQVLNDPRIGEILILDDCSDWAIYTWVNDLTNLHDKIKVVRQAVNRGMSLNKAHAVAMAAHEWVILFDSDNSLSPAYLDAIPEELFPDTIYMPSFARPEFNFQRYSGLMFDQVNVKTYIKDPMFDVMLNCCNYLVHKETYGKVYKYNPDIDAADTVNMAKNWLAAGNSFYVVPGMEYTHRVHKQSGFLANVNKNMKDAERIKKEIANL